MPFAISSPAFEDQATIPKKHTADGEDLSPKLEWTGVPDGTRSFAIIMDDPDAPPGTWVHWVLYDLPASASELPENVPNENKLPNGASQGRNDFRKIGYGGPCPPRGTHKYYFKLYALDTELGLNPGATKQQLLDAMKGHILAEAQLMGRYRR